MNALPKVKQQYETLPYPPRNPEDERKRLIQTEYDSLDQIAHYCFQGEFRFDKHFRCLVAGGGTGDAAIFLAEQLKNCGGQVTYLDMSQASLNIARRRAEIRGLSNIHWIQSSLLDLPKLNIGKFDYINCSGVLHHLSSPEEGLSALNSVLNDSGGMGLMLYAKYGRQEVYDMQSLLREIIPQNYDISKQVVIARKLIENLPNSNNFKQRLGKWAGELNPKCYGDSGLYDLLLHTQDRCYTVDQLYQLVESSDLYFTNFVGRTKSLYEMEHLSLAPEIENLIGQLNTREKYIIGEKFHGNIRKHMFFISRMENAEASITDRSTVMIFSGELAGLESEFYQQLVPGERLTIEYSVGSRTEAFNLDCNPVNKAIVGQIDGETSQKKIIENVIKIIPNINRDMVIAEIDKLFKLLHVKNWMHLSKPRIH